LIFMRKERETERKSARLERRRKVPTPSVSPRRGELFAEIEIEDSVLVTPPGETSSTPRSGSLDLNPDRQDPNPEGEETRSEEDAMSRLKYKTFKGDGHQDVDPTCRGTVPVYVGMPESLARRLDTSLGNIVFEAPSCTR
jgi:hypothetical protein